jgi:sulfatase maturation enzyme AslB (radical SAM superfamily)
MEKIEFEHLDLPIIRSCNLACAGCMTYSDHKNIKGIVNINESLDWLQFWSKRIKPKSITLFGGEPLLHPNFVEWVSTIKRFWPDSGVNVNTNGYYLDRIYTKIPELFNASMTLSMIISIQTGTEPYLTQTYKNIEIFKQKVLEYYQSLPTTKSVEWEFWLDESEINFKKWYRIILNGIRIGVGFGICEQYKLSWVTHYTGQGETMRPVYDYNYTQHTENYSRCHVKSFINLYRGRMYKCPPTAVLEHTLNTFNIQNLPEWAPYVTGYNTVGIESTDQEINDWFTRQKEPEKICNMCGLSGENAKIITAEQRSHELKVHWHYNLQTLNT